MDFQEKSKNNSNDLPARSMPVSADDKLIESFRPVFRKQGNLLTVSGCYPDFETLQKILSTTKKKPLFKSAQDEGFHYLIRIAKLSDNKTNIEFFYNAHPAFEKSVDCYCKPAPYFPAPKNFRLMPKEPVKNLISFLEKTSLPRNLPFFKTLHQIVARKGKDTLYIYKNYLPHLICSTHQVSQSIHERSL